LSGIIILVCDYFLNNLRNKLNKIVRITEIKMQVVNGK
jgi:hypothetical protein